MNKTLSFKLLFAFLALLIFSACGTTVPNSADEPDIQASALSVDRRITSGADDVEEVSTGAMYAPSGRLEIVKTENYGNQIVGLRFTNLAIPKGAKITNAQLFFTAQQATSAPTNVTVKGLKDAKPFPTTKSYLSSAAKTSAYNSWPPNPWTEVGVTDAYKTGNIANVVQELVSASTWTSGSALAFVIYGGQGDRAAESFESSPSQAVRLVVEYTTEPGEPSNPNAVPIIFDTDYGFDVDDVGALAVLNALENNGEAKILATMAVVTDRYTPGAMDAVNTYYKNPSVPLGQNSYAPDSYKWDKAFPYWRTPSPRFVWNLDTKFPNDTDATTSVPSAVSLYRKTLAAQPDGSVSIVAVGFMKNLADLMASKPDSYSSLSGKDLIKRKVKRLVVMGGSYPNSGGGRDFNLTSGPGKNVSDGQRVINEWPTEVVFTPGNVCGDIYTGQTLSNPSVNPVAEAYRLFFGESGQGRDSWDLCSVLYAVRGLSYGGKTYFKIATDKQLVLRDNAYNEWVTPGNARHKRLVRVMSATDITKVLNDLLTQAPK